ncbi:hypothetical protein JTE90_023286 [Oedothorax gibbosus]|uniref:Uncharacterized protein n=1 Tax=Oedothorax gibbosus TaxID=931172 RepID=A0AAV6UPS8_9ARAC|nr:hypothetical protein JTE90_023286 [Oedothorax gibbosus]
MKIEAEVQQHHHSSLLFTTPFPDVKGCSVPPLDLSATAQERASIDRPEQRPGCGSTALGNDQNNAFFDCEHFQFIDDEEGEYDGGDDSRPRQDDPLLQDDEKVNGGVGHKVNGSPSENGTGISDSKVVNGSAVVVKLRPHDSTESNNNVNHRNDGKVNGGSAVVKVPVCPATDKEDNMSESSVKRQVSFDDSMVEQPHPPCSCADVAKKELKSLLKRGGKSSSKRRVTFNEAVSLYSDEHEGIRLLQLTTGPDIICTDAFYMFEPPIEYQDVPPFEPPAEYRDDEDGTPTPPAEPADEESTLQEKKPEEIPATPAVEENLNVQQEQEKEVVVPEEQVVVPPNDTPKEIKTYGTDPCQVQTDSAKESDKLFERFLEAEREFAVDEELNNVFHELDSDFVNDGDNGALDDNFFRKLITLLSSAEGDAPLGDSDFLSSTKFANTSDETCLEAEDDDNSQTHSRTLSEADSDCSISSQDTIIVRLGEDENEQNSNIVNSTLLDRPKDPEFEQKPSSGKKDILMIKKQESFDEVFNNIDAPLPRESLVMKNMQMHQAAVVKMDKTSEESLSRQSSGEQSVNSGTSQDPPQDADDSTSSDSRSGEVEEEMRLDDVGYDEEDAEDYDEESFRGMARGNSKIRRIIKKNALQCTLFKGIEAKRRQQPGAKYPRPKSPLLSQESLVEKLKWLTTVDDQKDNDPLNFHSKPPDVILSTGEIPMNGSIPQSESDMRNAMAYQQQQQFYQMQQRFAMPHNSKGGYYVRQDGYHPSLPRQRMSCPGHPPQMSTHNLAYAPASMVAHPGNPQKQWTEQQRNMTVPRNFRDWRVIQRVMVGNRNSGDGSRSPQVPADYVRCANGTFSPSNTLPTDVSRQRVHKDELEQFVEQDSKRLDKLRRRYSLAEEDVDDPTFGFARRPSVRGIQTVGTRVVQAGPSDFHAIYEEGGQATNPRTANYGTGVYPNWRGPAESPYGSARPMHIHRASVALTELPGCATIPYAHRKPHPDPRYHSYAESMYGSTRTLPTKGSWDPRSSCHPNGPSPAVPASSHPMLQVPQPPNKGDERGVPEGASSSPKISSDSLYRAPEPSGPAQNKDEGVIYYSLNV